MTTLGKGDLAPDLALSTTAGEVTLASLTARGPVVVYFYPKNETPGCTVEACGFRDAYESFVDAGATVVGVSTCASSRGVPPVLTVRRGTAPKCARRAAP